MKKLSHCALALIAVSLGAPVFAAPKNASETVMAKEVKVFDDYGDAYRAAQQEGRMLLIYFHRPGTADDRFESQILLSQEVRARLHDYVVARLSTDARGTVEGKSIRFLDHPAFSEMRNCPGIAVIDLTDAATRHYGRVVSIYPFKAGRTLSRQQMATMLDLPSGSLTQRTLIFAVRVHPEQPASTDSRPNPVLAAESESHARYQAQLGVQGHHDWDHRFQRINARLTGLVAQEVCAESWPGQDLVDAAFECVDSWRQSPGHWSAVRSRNTYFGYDMKRGRNGIWYGTGIFARR
jgi:hypothetical protein